MDLHTTLRQGLTLAFHLSLGEYQGMKVQLLSGFLAHPSHADLVQQRCGFGREEHVLSWEFILTC